MVCVLAYALWKTLDHLAKRAGLMTEIRKPDPRRPRSSPKPRRMTPQVILRKLSDIKIGDILMRTTDGQELVLRRVARPEPEQARDLGGSETDHAGAADHPRPHFVVKTQPPCRRDSLEIRGISTAHLAT